MTRATTTNGANRARSVGAAPSAPMIPYVVWKFPRALAAALDEAAEERGATRAGLVRKILGDWVAARAAAQAGTGKRKAKAAR